MLTDEQYEIADRIEQALETAGREGLTPSRAARKARTTYDQARAVLAYLVANRYVHTSGNGAWTRFHAGRA